MNILKELMSHPEGASLIMKTQSNESLKSFCDHQAAETLEKLKQFENRPVKGGLQVDMSSAAVQKTTKNFKAFLKAL